MNTDSLEPVPDFVLYQDQAKQLDTLADRIDGFINALKVRGVYDAYEPSLARLFSEGENNTLIPVKNWAAFAEKQGMKGAIDLVDITPNRSDCLGVRGIARDLSAAGLGKLIELEEIKLKDIIIEFRSALQIFEFDPATRGIASQRSRFDHSDARAGDLCLRVSVW